MKKRLFAAVAGLSAAMALVLAPGASAATEFGSTCAANEGEPQAFSIWGISHAAGDPLPIAAPTAGVITSWKFNSTGLGLPPGIYSQRLQVVRPTGSTIQVVGESSPGTLSGGIDTFATRIPVQAGDLLGNYGEQATFYCKTGQPGDAVGYVEQVVPAGSSSAFAVAPAYKVAVSAAIEPDADGDGYGDETQDQCPQSAAYQTACPTVKVEAFAQAGGKSATVFVVTSLATSVKVSGSVKLGKGSTAKLSAKPATVTPGKIKKFKLQFDSKLMAKLKELEPGQKLTLKITASAKNLVGKASTDKITAKLAGRG